MRAYLPIFMVIGVTLGLSVAMILASSVAARLLRLSRPNPVKQQPYECGMTPIGSARVRFSIRFYLVAMLFILFDVEAIFLYPWAVVHRSLGWFGLVEMFLFILILGVGYLYIWKRGGFEWE